jgi:hypothetical protein
MDSCGRSEKQRKKCYVLCLHSIVERRGVATPLAGANVERGVEVVVTGKHGKQRG